MTELGKEHPDKEPEAKSHGSEPAPEAAPAKTIRPLASAKNWMLFCGIFLILFGITLTFSIVGVLTGLLNLGAGIYLVKASQSLRRMGDNEKENEIYFQKAQAKLKIYFILSGLFYMISVAVIVTTLFFFGWIGYLLSYDNAQGWLDGQQQWWQ